MARARDHPRSRGRGVELTLLPSGTGSRIRTTCRSSTRGGHVFNVRRLANGQALRQHQTITRPSRLGSALHSPCSVSSVTVASYEIS